MTLAVISERDSDLAGLAIEAGLTPVARNANAELELDPISLAIVVGGGIIAAKFVLSVFERWRGGVRIDLGTRPPTIERLRDVPAGLIIVLTADGEVEIHAVEEPRDSVERMVAAVLQLPAGVATTAVKETIGLARA